MFEKDRFNLLSIIEAIDKIQKYSQPFSNADDLFSNETNFDAVLMNFIVIGEMVVKLSDEFIMKFNQVDWHNIKGFRNIIAHNYFGVDAEEVWQIIKNDLPRLKSNIQVTIKEI